MMKILVIEDTLTFLTVACHQLTKLGFQAIPARDGASGLLIFEREKPDLVLLDIQMPGMDGFEIARRIRASEMGSGWTPIIFLTASSEDRDIDKAINAGGDDYLIKPVSEVVLGAKVRAMQRLVQMRHALVDMSYRLDEANQELQRLTRTDVLTGIANRRGFDEAFQREWRRCKRGEVFLALLICDVDFFKLYNDAYGHQAGDVCLRRVAQALAERARRPADLVARYGGEEFAAILPETEISGVLQLAESMRAAIEALAIPHRDSTVSSVVTISIGLAVMRPGSDGTPEALLKAADAALYMAKRRGRNRVYSHNDGIHVQGAEPAAGD